MAKKKTDQEPISFEQALEKLEQVVQQLEDGQLGLSESLAQYEEGVRHLKNCHQTLAAAERKIELLTSMDDAGNAKTEPLDDDDSPADESKQARKNRRSARAAKPSGDAPIEDDVDTQRGLF